VQVDLDPNSTATSSTTADGVSKRLTNAGRGKPLLAGEREAADGVLSVAELEPISNSI
jgi:hypothetical protein